MKGKVNRVLNIATLIFILLLCSFVLIATRGYSTKLTLSNKDIENELHNLESLNIETKRNINDKLSTDEVYLYATQNLGMKYPDKNSIIVVSDKNDKLKSKWKIEEENKNILLRIASFF